MSTLRSLPNALAGLPAVLLAGLLLSSCTSDRGSELPFPEGPAPLRVAVRSIPIPFLPRNADPVELDREIAEGLATALGRPLELVLTDDYSEMIDRLLTGEADLVAANLTATKNRRTHVEFSLPYLHVDELLVLPADAPAPTGEEDLADLEIAVRASSSYAETVLALQERVAGVEFLSMPETDNIEDILEKLAAGEIEATLIDSNIWSAVGPHFETLQTTLVLAEDRPIGLALAPGNSDLRRKVNEFLISRALTGPREGIYAEDLPALRKRGRLRMITRNNVATYFLHRGVQLGFEYELLKRFAESQDMRLEIVIPPSRVDLENWLQAGRGDVIAASMSIRDDMPRTSFTRRYATVRQWMVVRADEGGFVRGPDDLAGRTVHVRQSSSYLAPLRILLEETANFEIALVPEELETEDILGLVERGIYDVTVCDANLLDAARHSGREIVGAFPLAETDLGWAVRDDDVELRRALDLFLQREYRGLLYNLAWQRYFEMAGTSMGPEDTWRSDRSGRISPWDGFARRSAATYDLDWRLLVAQMYQESRFDPAQVSLAGASGLMQLVPRTARELGVGDVHDPESSIEGGAKYMRWLLDRYDPKLPLATRLRFTLASYNAGRGHVFDARRLARRLGLDPARWEDNVEKAILLLERREYYEGARFGYCRGSECTRYVREIDRRYRTYVDHVPDPLSGAGS